MNLISALASGTIRHINAIGFIVRIEVESSQTEQPIEVILTKENYLNAQYKIGDHVYLVPDKLNLFKKEYLEKQKVRSKSTALFIFKGENYFLPNCGKTESFPAVKRPT